MRIEQVTPGFVAEVNDVDLTHLDDHTWSGIEVAFRQYGVLIFHDQHLSRDEQADFARRFGELEMTDDQGYQVIRKAGVGRPMIVEISNVDENGQHITDPSHPQIRSMGGNEGWHSDSSYKPVAAKASVLAALEVPATGGATGFADMRAAYEELTDEEKDRFAALTVWHSLEYSQARNATGERPDADPLTMRGANHPLINHHPATGRPSLFVGRHASRVREMDLTDGQELLDRLLVAACQSPRLYMHSWKPGDVVVWDNRCVLHRASKWSIQERRVLRHVRVAGDAGNFELNPDARAADADALASDR
jgi:alpha-ketoglutarate-dependent taurine dioxygenase